MRLPAKKATKVHNSNTANWPTGTKRQEKVFEIGKLQPSFLRAERQMTDRDERINVDIDDDIILKEEIKKRLI